MSRLPLANEGEALFHIARFDEIEEAETAVESFNSSLVPPRIRSTSFNHDKSYRSYSRLIASMNGMFVFVWLYL
ncbi:hypothetical protein HSBAA_16570 [Vreelandella sulfidaeris]|uniref:Uncharacterized protein n=1 Tax=Vreelandella sulfidaeris TaxID=115553 RepID=A0A455U788_9GAMM|nr:hypothetical protein HSBAA_16570 [Halomonas sulfidaeris]